MFHKIYFIYKYTVELSTKTSQFDIITRKHIGICTRYRKNSLKFNSLNVNYFCIYFILSSTTSRDTHYEFNFN